MPHVPVLLHEVLEALKPCAGEFMIDGTANGGGHARALLARVGKKGLLLAIDWDAKQARALHSSLRAPNVRVVHGNYADTQRIMSEQELPRANGLLLDLGFSTEHLEHAGRGFSFAKDEPLLMTYDEERMPAKEVLRRLREEDLMRILFRYGEERYARRIAHAIVHALRTRPIDTSGVLAEIVAHAVPKSYERGRIHPATRTFQALRIYVNGELENLEALLASLPEIMAVGGRVAIISFHSLEDRMVKQAFRALAQKKLATLMTKKPITPAREEEIKNPKSRSAKLRVLVMHA